MVFTLLRRSGVGVLSNRTKVVTAISHHLRTPLTRLKLRMENLQDEVIYTKLMNDINEMELMIRDTLSYFQDVHSTEQSQPFDLVSLLHFIKEDMQEIGAKITFFTKCDKLVYTGEVNLLKRALVNIVSNAIYYANTRRKSTCP